MPKGQRNEKRAADLYDDAGFWTFRPPRARGGPTDIFGLFDLAAFEPGEGLQLVQVKTNRPKGIEAFCRETLPFNTTQGLMPVMLVRYDGHGGPHPTPPRWRLLYPTGEDSYHDMVDEREDGVPADGESVTAWLEGRDGD